MLHYLPEQKKIFYSGFFFLVKIADILKIVVQRGKSFAENVMMEPSIIKVILEIFLCLSDNRERLFEECYYIFEMHHLFCRLLQRAL